MRSFLIPAALALAIALPAVAAPKPSPTSLTRRAIEAAYDTFGSAAAQRKLDTLMTFMAPGFEAIDPQAQMYQWPGGSPRFGGTPRRVIHQNGFFRAFCIEGHYPGSPKDVQAMTQTTTIQSLTMQDGSLLVLARDHAQFTIVPEEPIVPTPVFHYAFEEKHRDLWVKTTQGWKLKRTVVLSYISTVNGKRQLPAPPPVPDAAPAQPSPGERKQGSVIDPLQLAMLTQSRGKR